jgi:predicted Zn finger-like uncharacterized protein
MFTVCPKCALTLVVTAEDLRVAQGYVRCGRCSSVFNALARLAEERPAPEESVKPAPPAPAASPPGQTPPQTPPPASPAPAPAPAANAPPPGVTDEDAIPEEALEFNPAKTDVSSVFVEVTDGDAIPEEALEFNPANIDVSSVFVVPPRRVTDEDSIPEDALEFNPAKTDVSSVFVEPPPNPQWTAATGTFKAMIAANQEAAQAPPPASPAPAQAPAANAPPPSPQSTAATGTFKAVIAPHQEAAQAPDSDSQIDVEIDPELLASILHIETPVAPAPTAAPPPVTPRPSEAARAPDLPTAAASSVPRPAPRPAAPPARPAPETTVSAPAPSQPRAPRKTRLGAHADERAGRARLLPNLWRAGAAVALLALLAQIVNHYRDQLAATTRFHRPITELYASLGVPLVPHWDLRAYEVRQLGASVEPTSSGLITVRASIKNAAPQPQPLPLLRVTLQDRFGNRIAARDVAPQSYLPHAPPPPALLSAGERIDAEMGFVDPGANAVGFEIDACLPIRGGEVTCANDALAR